VLATTSGVLAVEGLSVLDQVARGLVQKHSWLKFEGSRVLNLAQDAPCLKREVKKLGCCRME
jgi:hypothetical protein